MNRPHPLPLATVVALLLAASPAVAQNASDLEKKPHRNDENGSRQVTAEDLLRALQRQRPANEIISPASRTGKPDPSTTRALLPEGSTTVERSGGLSQDGSWWLFQPLCDDRCSAVKLLPNTQLELMVRTLAGAESPMSFIVSGELTVFEKENFLLVKHAARGAPIVEAPPKATPPTADVPTDASAEDVLAKLQIQHPEQAAMAYPSVDPAKAPQRSAADGRTLMLDGSPVVNRTGRLVREGSWWMLAFESNRPDAAEPTVRMLPNQVLELMARTSQQGAIGLVFIVSGEATLYEGENYLLARSVTRRVDLGNLRK